MVSDNKKGVRHQFLDSVFQMGYHAYMEKLFVLYTALSVFGIGITIIDFLGVLDHHDNADGVSHGDGSSHTADDFGDSDSSAEPADYDVGDSYGGHDYGDSSGGHDSGDSSGGHDSGHSSAGQADHPGSYLSPGQSGVRAVTIIMGILRTTVYFSLGFGPTGLFAWFRGLSPGMSLLWALGVGSAISVLARLLRRFIRHDLDSSIKSEEFLMETGMLLLPLMGDEISKISVKRYGRETELYVKSKDKTVKFPKGKIVRIIDYNDNIYWVESAE